MSDQSDQQPTIRRDVKYGHCLWSSPYFISPSKVHTPFGIRLCGSKRSRFCNRQSSSNQCQGLSNIVIYAHRHIFSPLLLLFHKSRRQTSTPCIDDSATLLSFDRGMKTKIFSTCQTKSAKIFFAAKLLLSILHEGFKF